MLENGLASSFRWYLYDLFVFLTRHHALPLRPLAICTRVAL